MGEMGGQEVSANRDCGPGIVPAGLAWCRVRHVSGMVCGEASEVGRWVGYWCLGWLRLCAFVVPAVEMFRIKVAW